MPEPSTPPLPVEARRERLLALIGEEGFVRVGDASEVFGVSEVTLRSDLSALEAAGALRRVHGGAMAARGEGRESPVEATAERDAEVKRAIGRRAAALVSSGSSILLDVGSTTLAVARALVERAELSGLTVITNGLSIALALEPAIPRFTVVVTGGTLRPLQHSLVNPLAAQTLAGLHVDLAILGCNGIDDDGRVTNLNLPEAEVKRAMLAAAEARMLVADGSKAGQRHLGLIAGLGEFGTLVTGGPGADGLRAAAATAGTRVVIAEERLPPPP
ncbi:MAG TPA: DeoR/GlpR family DNA-binding transcription regulator [Pseudolysinimonas sp.]|nr:DeoR/GlpR family DNA-binding transcription regulator [Pseudolysinimonas sp.]